MKKLITVMAGVGLAFAAMSASATPENDRAKVVNFLKDKYSNVKVDDYIFGALAYSPDAKSQYDAIMEFPPYVDEIDKGKKLWDTPFKNGKTYADCMPSGGKMIAGNYPMFDEAKGKVVTFENLLNDCRVANGEEAYKYTDMNTIGLLSAYARTLSDGMKMNVKVDTPAALKAFEDGKKTYYSRAGQLNFSCANCHIDAAGNNLRSEILSPVLGQATHWPVFRAGTNLVTLQTRYVGCFKQVRHVPDVQNSTRFNNLEYFHSYLSNGMEMKASVFRK